MRFVNFDHALFQTFINNTITDKVICNLEGLHFGFFRTQKRPKIIKIVTLFFSQVMLFFVTPISNAQFNQLNGTLLHNKLGQLHRKWPRIYLEENKKKKDLTKKGSVLRFHWNIGCCIWKFSLLQSEIFFVKAACKLSIFWENLENTFLHSQECVS